MKTFDKKDVFSWSNAEEAKEYIDKKGYFSNFATDNLVEWYLGTLSEISLFNKYRIARIFTNKKGEKFGLFLPLDKVKEVEEKKWRAFKNFMEFFNYTNKKLGSEITYRNKRTGDAFYAVITRVTVSSSAIDLGAHTYNLHDLFMSYEWLNDNEWQPFGVEE